jgi:hypothetical protein
VKPAVPEKPEGHPVAECFFSFTYKQTTLKNLNDEDYYFEMSITKKSAGAQRSRDKARDQINWGYG